MTWVKIVPLPHRCIPPTSDECLQRGAGDGSLWRCDDCGVVLQRDTWDCDGCYWKFVSAPGLAANPTSYPVAGR